MTRHLDLRLLFLWLLAVPGCGLAHSHPPAAAPAAQREADARAAIAETSAAFSAAYVRNSMAEQPLNVPFEVEVTVVLE